jgi:hypothetical protein
VRVERERRFSDIPDCLSPEERYDEDGDELCIEYVGPTWGEGPAGREWYEALYAILVELGWASRLSGGSSSRAMAATSPGLHHRR